MPSFRTRFGEPESRETGFAAFVSRIWPGQPWYDIHIPLAPARRSTRVAVSGSGPSSDVRQAGLQ